MPKSRQCTASSGIDFSIDEAVRKLSEYGLEKIQSVLGLTDDDIADIILNDCEVFHEKILSWFADYLNDSVMEINENKYL